MDVVRIIESSVSTTNSLPYFIATSLDSHIWFNENSGNKIGQITTAGVITEFAVPTANSGPIGIKAGPDGNLWFSEVSGNKIGKLVPQL